jgi:exodeoxyribonuclease-3
MKLISWNVNGIRAAYKKGFGEFLKTIDPDVLCLQETKAHPEQVPPDQVNPPGRVSYWSSAEKRGYSGVATYCKRPPGEVIYGIGAEEFDREGRVVVTRWPAFDLYNIYFPNGARGPDRHEYKLRFLNHLSNHISGELKMGRNIIVVGDYNIAPADIDIYDPVKHAKTSGFLPIEKEWYQGFLNLGFVDTFRHFHPDRQHMYSWWNQMERARMGNRGWRIDMICISKSLLPALKSAEVHMDIEGSDHCPVSVELDLSLDSNSAEIPKPAQGGSK